MSTKMKTIRFAGVAAAACLGLMAAGCQKQKSGEGTAPAAGEPAAPRTLTIWWAQWAPADGLQALAEEFGRKENVTVKVHQIPWSSFQDQVFQEFGKPTTAFDIVVGDSQWLGRGATKGLYVDLTGWLPTAADLKSLHPLALKYLAEYPTGSGHYYAAPAETDAMGWAYRKDWFEDPAEKAAFKKKYKRELAVPETWDDLKTIAEFFTRPDKQAIRQRAGHGPRLRRHRDGLRAAAVRVRRRVGRPEDDEGPGRARFGRTRSRRSTSSRPCSSTRRPAAASWATARRSSRS